MRFRHPQKGTEIEADEDASDALAADGYKAVRDGGDSSSEHKTSGRSRKKDD